MQNRRIFIVMLVFLVIYISLLGKVFFCQVIKGDTIARQAVAMRSKKIELKEYSRGEIYDRNLVPLTSTRSSSALYCLPGEIASNHGLTQDETLTEAQAFKQTAQVLSSIIREKSQEQILAMLNSAARQSKPLVRIAADLSQQEIQQLSNTELSGVVIAPVIKRYGQEGFCAHILGYVDDGQECTGKAGLEKKYDNILNKNSSSQELISVLDARGIVIAGLRFKIRPDQEEHKGCLVLTIDKRIQEIVETAMSKSVSRGAVVVMDVRSKEILAAASRPTFNPYQIGEALNNKNEAVLTNRVFARYHPGSLFKILVTAAALEEQVVTTDTTFECRGKHIFNSQVAISCWQEEGHGKLDLAKAFAVSCNPWYIEAGLKLNRGRLLNYVEQMKICRETLVGYGNTGTGSFVKINPGEPAMGNACLGQQGVMISPLQVASLIATIADDGIWGAPILVRYQVDQQGHTIIPAKTPPERVISLATARTIQQLMEKVVSEGTGQTADLAEVKVAGKTATSQTGIFNDKNQEQLNTWFAGYFPADKPRWAIVVLVEQGESGARDAAPVFKEIARQMLECFSVTAS